MDTLPSVLFYADLSRPFVPTDLESRALGGSETALAQVARGLAGLGHRVAVAGHPGKAAGVYDGVEYVDVASDSWRGRGDIDITVVFRQLPHVRRRLPGRFRLFWAHDHIGIYPELPPGIRRRLLEGAWSLGHRLFGRHAPGVVAVSRWLGDCFVRYARWPEESVWAIPNGIDPTLYDGMNGASRSANAGARSSFRVAYTSVPERGLKLLISHIMPAIWRSIPEVELHVFSYQALDGYRQLADAADQRIRFRGGLRQADLARELAGFDLWLYPTDFPETSCIAAIEAQAASVPIISSKRYALRDTVVDGETGILLDEPVGSAEYVERFVATAISLLRDPGLRAKMGTRARERVLSQFTWHRISSAWSKLLQRVRHERSSLSQ